MTAFSRLSRFGMTFKLLTESLGADVLTWFLAAFPVRTSHALERVQESKESDHPCGNTWRESSVKFDLNTHLWKTHRCLWEEVLPSSSLTLPKWGMMRDGALWERTTPPLLTSETESGLWRTPTAHEWKNTGHSTQIHLSDQVRPSQVKNPKKAAAMWPTPTLCGNYNRKGLSKTSGDGLATAVRQWPTPTAQDSKNNGAPSQMERNTKPLNAEVGGALNPTWVEWLMGWPLGWTDCDASATAKFRQWLDSHGKR
jgi:hypothetical protein